MPTSDQSATVLCNLCGADDYTVLFAPGAAQANQVVICNRCGLMYANPRTLTDIDDIESWEDNPDWDYEFELPWLHEKERLQVRDYASTRAKLLELHPNRGKLIELGSSMGFLLAAFRDDGWSVLGVEPDKNGCRHATRKLEVPTIATTLEAAHLPAESADVIVMLSVIEHVPDPLGTLREAHRILKADGHLVIETPRYDSLAFKVLGKYERNLSCPGHIFFFTTETLKNAYTIAGFELLHMGYQPRSLTLDRLIYSAGAISKSAKLQQLADWLPRRLKLQNVAVTINLRDTQLVVLRKKRHQPAV